MAVTTYAEVSWERINSASEKVRLRLLHTVAILAQAKIPYAVTGDNAVAAWVSRIDEAAVRNTQDVDIILRRTDLPAARQALEKSGFLYRHVAGIDMFLDAPGAKTRDAVHIVFAAEKVRPDYFTSVPDVSESEDTGNFRLVSLDALVRMKLTSFRDKDRVHLRDMIDVGLVDESWLLQVPAPLRSRLQELLDNPEG